MRITTLFWDIGGVLFSEAQISRPEFRQIRDLLGMDSSLADKLFHSLWKNKMELGKTDENTFWRENVKHADNNPSIRAIKQLYRNKIRVNQSALDIVATLSLQYAQFVVSNHGREWMDYLIEHWGLNQYFTDFFCSAYLKIAKPDPKFFKLALEKSGKSPTEILYIDDSMKNIKAAQELGVNVIFYEGYLKKGVTALRKDLMRFIPSF